MVSSDCHWLSPACSGEIITTVSFWTAALAAGGGRRWSQSDRSKVPGPIRSKPCIRDLQTQSVTHPEFHLHNQHIHLMGIGHLASSRSAFCRYCSSGLVGSQLCSSKYEAISNVSVLWQVDEDHRSMQNPQLKKYSFYFLYALLVLIIVCQFVAETIDWNI